MGQASPVLAPHQPNPVDRVGRQPELDGLRALAVLAVLAWHGWTPHLNGGSLGVDVFFVLSGYLITRILADEIVATGRIDLSRFAVRRLRRLAPALFVVLAAYAAVDLSAAERWRDVAYAGLYLTNVTEALAPRDSPLVHTWSLAAEVQFYLLLPLALPWLIRHSRRRGAAILFAAWLVVTLARLGWIHAGGSKGVAYYAPIFHCTGLLLGASLSLRPPSIRIGWAALVVVVVTIFLADTRRGAAFAYAIPLVEFATALALVNPPRLLAAPGLVALGSISYGIYLWHLPIWWALKRAGGLHAWLPLNAATLVLSTAMAAASYLILERRFTASRAKRPQSTMARPLAGSGFRDLGHEPSVVSLHGGVAFAGGALEALSVDDLDHAASGADQAGLLQTSANDRHGGALDAQHLGQGLLGQGNATFARAVVSGQEPAGAAFIDGMERIAGRGLHQLREQGVGKARDEIPDGRPVVLDAVQPVSGDCEGAALDLHHRLTEGRLVAGGNNAADGAFPADGGHLDRLALPGDEAQGDHGVAGGEIGRVDVVAGLEQHGAPAQADRLKVGLDEPALRRAQAL